MSRRFFLLLILSLSTLLAPRPALAERLAGHVLIVSFDGGKPAVIQQASMPALQHLVQGGASTWKAQTVFPSITLVSHTSMLTGVGPDKHKITWNSWQPEKGPVTVPTVFGIAKQAGLHTALFAGKDKFKHLNVPGTLDEFAVPGDKAKDVAAAAAKYIQEKKPDLIFVHFPDPDSAGHKFGWGSPEQVQALADSDAALKVLMDALDHAGIAADTVSILSADHGGHGHGHGSNDPEDMTIPWIAYGKNVKTNYTIQNPPTTYDTAATALYVLGIATPKEFDGKAITEAFSTAK